MRACRGRSGRCLFRCTNDGLIYRGKRMINWCPRCMTALANIEVEGEDLDSFLYYIRYPLVNGKGGLVVATTRPETMLGDTAVAVNPEDQRYTDYIGRKVILPIVGRPIPVIGDAYVEREFGTGALKVTPAHDFNDFELSRKHNLDLVQVIDERGIMTAEAGQYEGMDRSECRRQILKDLEKDRLPGKGRTVQTPGRALLPVCQRGRADAFPSVVRIDQAAGGCRHGCCPGRQDPDRSRQMGKGLLHLDGKCRRLVHKPANLVGAPHPRLVLRGMRRRDRLDRKTG